MSQVIPNSFTTYALSDSELLESGSFSTLQLQGLQSLMSMAAEEKLNMTFDHTDPVEFSRQIAYKQGVIDTYAHLIATSLENQNYQDLG